MIRGAQRRPRCRWLWWRWTVNSLRRIRALAGARRCGRCVDETGWLLATTRAAADVPGGACCSAAQRRGRCAMQRLRLAQDLAAGAPAAARRRAGGPCGAGRRHVPHAPTPGLRLLGAKLQAHLEPLRHAGHELHAGGSGSTPPGKALLAAPTARFDTTAVPTPPMRQQVLAGARAAAAGAARPGARRRRAAAAGRCPSFIGLGRIARWRPRHLPATPRTPGRRSLLTPLARAFGRYLRPSGGARRRPPRTWAPRCRRAVLDRRPHSRTRTGPGPRSGDTPRAPAPGAGATAMRATARSRCCCRHRDGRT